MISTLPDTLLGLGMRLPTPADRLSFAVLKRLFLSIGRLTPIVVPIRFGGLTISAPLTHSAVYWRYRPASMNRNYVLLTQHVLNKRKGIIVDVGANIGDGIVLLRSQSIDTPVYAIECADDTFDLLRENTAELDNVILEKAYLGASAQTRDQPSDRTRVAGTATEGGAAPDVTTLDSLLDARSNPAVAMLKTDTDGFDAKVLYGSAKTIDTQRPIIFAEVMENLFNKNGDSSSELLRYLASKTYSRMMIWDNDGVPLGCRDVAAGLSDLLPTYPGEQGKPYLDIAFCTEEDRSILDAVEHAAYHARPCQII